MPHAIVEKRKKTVKSQQIGCRENRLSHAGRHLPISVDSTTSSRRRREFAKKDTTVQSRKRIARRCRTVTSNNRCASRKLERSVIAICSPSASIRHDGELPDGIDRPRPRAEAQKGRPPHHQVTGQVQSFPVFIVPLRGLQRVRKATNQNGQEEY